MTLAEQIKNAVTAAISILRADIVKPPATPHTSSPAPAPAAGISDEVRAEISTGIATALEPINAELIQAKADLATAKQTIGSLQTASTAKDTKIAELEATIANPKGKIELVAAAKAIEIAGAQGVPALAVKPVENPAAPASASAGLKGRARLEAGITAELKTSAKQ